MKENEEDRNEGQTKVFKEGELIEDSSTENTWKGCYQYLQNIHKITNEKTR